jgi:hypothetical protein
MGHGSPSTGEPIGWSAYRKAGVLGKDFFAMSAHRSAHPEPESLVHAEIHAEPRRQGRMASHSMKISVVKMLGKGENKAQKAQSPEAAAIKACRLMRDRRT